MYVKKREKGELKFEIVILFNEFYYLLKIELRFDLVFRMFLMLN